jgi:Zn-dependent protease/CBS domain-containing protein
MLFGQNAVGGAGDAPLSWMLGRGISLGSWFGVKVRLDWSLIVIFVLIASSLAAGVFPAWHPDWTPGLAWFTAIIATALFLLSILIHELAHAIVARAYGIPVHSITLFLFGGVANIEQEPTSPTAEALMAVVGPAASIGLGIFFSLLGTALGRAETRADPVLFVRSLSPAATLLVWVGPMNVFIGIFNMIPAFPLDGGRLLRAIFWAASRSLQRATRWASWVGQAIAWAFIIVGIAMAFGAVVPFFGSGFISGLWLAFIGWFLYGAAVASYRQVILQSLLTDVPVAWVMRKRSPPAVPGDEPVSKVVDERVLPSEEDLFLVESGGAIVGVVSTPDILKVPRGEWAGTPVRAIVTPFKELHAVSPSTDAYDALRTLGRIGAAELMVIDQGKVVGIVRREDIMRWLELHPHVQPPRDHRLPAPMTS